MLLFGVLRVFSLVFRLLGKLHYITQSCALWADHLTSSVHRQLLLIFTVQLNDFFKTSFQRSTDLNQGVQPGIRTTKNLNLNRSRETESSGNSLKVEVTIFSHHYWRNRLLSLSCHWLDVLPLFPYSALASFSQQHPSQYPTEGLSCPVCRIVDRIIAAPLLV